MPSCLTDRPARAARPQCRRGRRRRGPLPTLGRPAAVAVGRGGRSVATRLRAANERGRSIRGFYSWRGFRNAGAVQKLESQPFSSGSATHPESGIEGRPIFWTSARVRRLPTPFSKASRTSSVPQRFWKTCVHPWTLSTASDHSGARPLLGDFAKPRRSHGFLSPSRRVTPDPHRGRLASKQKAQAAVRWLETPVEQKV